MSRHRLTLLILSLALCSPLQAASKVKLEKGGKTVSLSNVTATRFVPNEGSPKLFLLFTDVPAQDVVLADAFGEAMLTVNKWIDGKPAAHAVEVSFEENDPANFSLSAWGEGMMSGGGGHRSGGEVTGVFKKINVTEKKVSGELKAEEEPGKLTGTFDVEPKVVHEAPVIRGAAVAKSPQAAALLGFTRAMKKFDLKAAQQFAARNMEEQFAEAKKALGEKDAKAMLAEMIGDPKKLEQQLHSDGATLLESGDQAKIKVTETIKDASGQGSTTQTFSLRKIDGKWKVD